MTASVVGIGISERLVFTLFEMPCCGRNLCWVQPRFPRFCPSCGEACGAQLQSGDHTLKSGPGMFRFEEAR